MIFLGVDPGDSGAIVIIEGVKRIPVVVGIGRNDWTEHELSDWLRDAINGLKCFAMLEKVGSMPKQGVSSTFKFGYSAGFLKGLLVANRIPFEMVTPGKWQGAISCRTKGDKNVTKQKAGELFPATKWTHRTADAVLLAEYGRRKYMGLL